MSNLLEHTIAVARSGDDWTYWRRLEWCRSSLVANGLEDRNRQAHGSALRSQVSIGFYRRRDRFDQPLAVMKEARADR